MTDSDIVAESASVEGAVAESAVVDDAAWVVTCLGRRPRSRYEIVARDAAGRPSVIRNPPLLDDGTPMPTRYWLIDPTLTRRIGTIEAAGGVDEAEREVGPAALADLHARYAAERDAVIPPDRTGPRPSGGVGGTRIGVKCLHAHYAWYLAGGDDAVGRWVHARLTAAGPPGSPGPPESPESPGPPESPETADS